ncbi:MAG: hypothetical protein AVDCRST_MAG11-570, partial [uncultured Gemmatimonadaceae bacterium]
ERRDNPTSRRRPRTGPGASRAGPPARLSLPHVRAPHAAQRAAARRGAGAQAAGGHGARGGGRRRGVRPRGGGGGRAAHGAAARRGDGGVERRRAREPLRAARHLVRRDRRVGLRGRVHDRAHEQAGGGARAHGPGAARAVVPRARGGAAQGGARRRDPAGARRAARARRRAVRAAALRPRLALRAPRRRERGVGGGAHARPRGRVLHGALPAGRHHADRGRRRERRRGGAARRPRVRALGGRRARARVGRRDARPHDARGAPDRQGRRAAVGAAHRARGAPAPAPGLLPRHRDERGARRAVLQPHQPEPARGARLHVRRALGLLVAAGGGAVRRGRGRAERRDRGGRARGAQGDRPHAHRGDRRGRAFARDELPRRRLPDPLRDHRGHRERAGGARRLRAAGRLLRRLPAARARGDAGRRAPRRADAPAPRPAAAAGGGRPRGDRGPARRAGVRPAHRVRRRGAGAI